MYTVYDSKAKVFLQPFLAQSDEIALRNFAYAANDKGTDIGRFPTDFSLHCIGTFCDESAMLDVFNQSQNLGIAVTFIKE